MICLNMIVKNEVGIIEKCLASAAPHIDSWLIVDTGSTDGTQDKIREVMARLDIPGELVERPWINFEHNRNDALELARSHGDYILFLDADEEIETPDRWTWPVLNADVYVANRRPKGSEHTFARAVMIRAAFPFYWKGVVHEAIEADIPSLAVMLSEFLVWSGFDGARNQDRDKYKKDMETLRAEHESNPTDTRTVFYLAQSYRDMGNLEKAIELYEKRSEMGGFPEEVWYSLYQVASLRHAMNLDPDKTVMNYLQAYQFRPTRTEPLLDLVRFFRDNKGYNLALMFALVSRGVPRPAGDILFVDEASYTWKPYDEIGVVFAKLGRYSDAVEAFEMMLKMFELPEQQKERVLANIALVKGAMEGAK